MFAALKRYADFQGRSRRSEFWLFYLFVTAATIICMIIDIGIGLFDHTAGIGLLSGVFSLAVVAPSIAVGVRRLHDIDRSGWWLLLLIIPVIGSIWLLILWCQKGANGSNKFGEDPLADQT